jgi:hypothetical protein
MIKDVIIHDNPGRAHGVYTELVCAFKLGRRTPQHIVDTLLFMTGQSITGPSYLEAHPLFGDTQWEAMLRG